MPYLKINSDCVIAATLYQLMKTTLFFSLALIYVNFLLGQNTYKQKLQISQ